MKGLELSRMYFEECGRNIFKKEFPEIFPRMAFGLAGEGSDCFGFDDCISRDHDWGPSFCIWMEEEDFIRYGQKVQEVYDSLPQSFYGYPVKPCFTQGGKRAGVLCLEDWYRQYTGTAEGPQSFSEWRRIPEHFLAAATNGEVFLDNGKKFSRIRGYLLSYYPEDIRLKKIVYQASVMAQSGQYNYPRCAYRDDAVAASLALSRFMEAGLSMIYLLNKRYAPFYKWMYKGILGLPVLKSVRSLFLALMEKGDYAARRMLIEQICLLVSGELCRQGLSDCKDSFLLNHCSSIMDRIQDSTLRASHVMVP